jgi:phosphoglucan, water dikinase
LAAFRSLTELRRRLRDRMERRPGAELQELLLTDLGLEDFAFVLLSRMLNALDAAMPRPSDEDAAPKQRGQDARPTVWQWQPVLEALRLTLANLALSSIEPQECGAIESELRAWSQGFDSAQREDLLRLKATADRSRRLAEDFSDRILALFSQRANKLGRALGVAEHALRVFCDAEIRGHLIFQLSKLASLLLRSLRAQLALPAWDVLVGGRVVGRLRSAGALEQLDRELPEPLLVLLDQAAGDEEMPKGVAGIVLAHDMPHLSHLGVRARQAGVVFVACEEKTSFEAFKALEGQVVCLTATPERVELRASTGTFTAKEAAAPSRQSFLRLPAVRLNPERPWLSLEETLPQCGGAKADGVRRLAELARRSGAGFKTPPAIVVPFGVMENALAAVRELQAEYSRLLKTASQATPEELTSVAERLRRLIEQLPVPAELVSEVSKRFAPDARLMVRSSANCEDLAELAGAGLYDSLANVAPEGAASAVRAVWASLWTRRAALSRRQAGLPHEQAHMAVLIQPMLVPDLSFVLHTVNPLNQTRRELYAEIAVGLGETLASGAVRGNPWRWICNKESGAVSVLAFANFSQALRPARSGALARQTVDYSLIELSRSREARAGLGRRLAAVGRFVEEAFRQPQDIEGAVVSGDIFLVQARPQQGLEALASDSSYASHPRPV